MARNLRLKTNVQPPDSDYPYGKIKDDDGSGNGTPVNEQVYGDFHQFFARIFAKSGYTYNGLPDSEYSGFQFYDALLKVCKQFIGVKTISATTNMVFSDMGKLINVSGTSGFIDLNIPNGNILEDGSTITVYNNSSFQIIIASQGSESINGGADLTLVGTGDFVTLVLDKANTDWKIANLNLTITPTPVIVANPLAAYNATQTATAVTTYVNKFTTEDFDVDGINNTSTGQITPIKSGKYNISSRCIVTPSSPTTATYTFCIYKNGSQIATLDRCVFNSSNDAQRLALDYIIDANGTTDYFEIVVFTSNSQTYTVGIASVVLTPINRIIQ